MMQSSMLAAGFCGGVGIGSGPVGGPSWRRIHRATRRYRSGGLDFLPPVKVDVPSDDQVASTMVSAKL